MPDKREIKDSLIGNAKIDAPKFEFDRGNKRYKRDKHKIYDRNDLGRFVIF
jgi:hypothetical protein